MKKILIVVLFAFVSLSAGAQRFSIGTNAIDWANFGTANLDLGLSVAQHVSLVAGAKYNPWDFSKADEQIYNKLMDFYAGLRIWTWYANSGLWFQIKGQYADYKITGTWRHALDEGKAVGGGLAIGYSYMINDHFNIEIGAGGWGGYLLEHNLYECADCKRIRESGPRAFIDLDNITVGFVVIL